MKMLSLIHYQRVKIIVIFWLFITTSNYLLSFEEWHTGPWFTNHKIDQIVCYKSEVYGLSKPDLIGMSLDGGNSFFPSYISGVEDININYIYVNKTGLFVTTVYDGIFLDYRDTNIGLIGHNVTNFCVDDLEYYYACVKDTKENGGGVYRSIDKGANWSYSSSGILFNDSNVEFIPYNIANILDTLYLMSSQGFYFSFNNGELWSIINSDSIDFFNNSPRKIVADDDGNLFLLINNKIYLKKSNENFNNIYRIFRKDENIKFVDFVTYKNYLFVINDSTRKQILYSTDKGDTFIDAFDGLFDYKLNCIAVTSNGTLYAGGNVLLRNYTFLNNIKENELNKITLHFLSSFPNPFSEKTRISFNLENPAYTKLTIYNSLGYVINVLANDYLSEGTHEFTFDGSALASGTYYYVLQAGGKVETGQLVLIK